MIKNSGSSIAIFLSLLVVVNILFLDPLQCFVYLFIMGLFTWVVRRPFVSYIKLAKPQLDNPINTLKLASFLHKAIKR